jgi:DNA-binding NarL/FixJ family response regulator
MSTHIATSYARKKVFLVDDHPLVREWLANLIRQQPDLAICGEAEDKSGTLTSTAAKQADLIIVDLNLKESSGVELIRDLIQANPAALVLVLSMHDEAHFAERAFRAGARGYVNKRESAKSIVEAIRRVLAGKLYVSEGAAEILAAHSGRRRATVGGSRVEILSGRELEVFEKLGQGIGTRQIATDLSVSIKTVQAYCARIKEKLDLGNATELLREAVRWYDAKNS